MFVGHYSAAFVAKAASRTTPLWVLVLAVQLVDVVWGVLVIAGIERVRVDPSLPSNPLVLEYMPFTHSLPATLLWCLAGFALARAWLGGGRAAVAVGLAVGSHWLLDLVVHRPDLPLWDDAYKVGLALWNHPVPALVLELALLGGSAWVLTRSGALPPARRRALGIFVALLALAHLVFSFGPAPPTPALMATSAVAVFLLAAYGAARVEGVSHGG